MADAMNRSGILRAMAQERGVSLRWLIQEAYLRGGSRVAAAGLLGVTHQALDMAVSGEGLQEAVMLVPQRGHYWLGYDKETKTELYDDARWTREAYDKAAANIIRFLGDVDTPEIDKAIQERKKKR